MSLEACETLSALMQEMASDQEATELFQWLRLQVPDRRVALYAPGSFFLHAALVPAAQLDRSWDDLTEWSDNPFDHPSCGLMYGGGEGARMELPPVGRQSTRCPLTRHTVSAWSVVRRGGWTNARISSWLRPSRCRMASRAGGATSVVPIQW